MAAAATSTTQRPLDIQSSAFPAPSKSTSGIAANHLTAVSTISFTDRFLLTVSQTGKLSHWVHVPLATSSTQPGLSAIGENSLLPRTELTATTVLGGTKREDEVMGQTLATVIAEAILVKRPEEGRLLVLGLGLERLEDMGRQGFEEVLGLVLECL